MTSHAIRIALDGVVKLLSQNLYGEPDAFLREMIQNAHDSITKRRGIDDGGGRIDIAPDRARATIAIHDDGIGLSEEEIHAHVSTIGRSGTGELRETLRAGDPARAASLIGQFGIGLLSAFLVADRVTIVTRRLGEDAAWRWEFDGGTQYELAPTERAAVGTTVTLHLKPSMHEFMSVERLEGLVRRYADFLPVEIRVAGAASPTNAMAAPWDHEAASDDTLRRFFARRFPKERALTHVALRGEVLGEPLRGVLAITDRTIELGQGRIDLYVRRMFVSGHQPGLRPPWATFVQGVVACDALAPTASRDRVVHDAALAEVSRLIGQAIFEHLRAIAARDPATLAGALRWHSHAILALCAEHEELFRDLADLMPLKSTLGARTIAELVRENPDGPRLAYYCHGPSAQQVLPLCSARGMPVLDLAEPYAERFVLAYASAWPERLQPFRIDEAGAGGLLARVPAAEAMRLRPVLRAAEALARRERVELAAFDPPGVAAVRLETRRGRGARELRAAVEHLGTPSFLSAALADVGGAGADSAILYLNAASPLLVALARRNRLAKEPDRTVLGVLLDRARDADVDAEERARAFEDLSRALEWALSTPEEEPDVER